MTDPVAPDFPPDSRHVAAVMPSPNHGERHHGRRPDMLILHYTGMRHADEALARLRHPASEVSAHYVVFEDGRVVQLVPEGRRAWHAGAGTWGLDYDINTCSIGIEIANPGRDGGLPPYPDEQIAAVTTLSADIAARWSIRPDRVLGHSDVAPDRKDDPGELFPWGRLHAAGVGHWTEPAAKARGSVLSVGAEGRRVGDVQRMLAAYGYGLDATGVYDAATEAVVTAFQRHFRPDRVDGVLDASTLATLTKLLATRPSGGGRPL